MAAADLFLLNQHPDMIEAVIPSKLLTYMAASRPIIVAAHPESEAARQVRTADCGLCVPPNQPADLANAIVWLAKEPTARAILGRHGREFAIKYYARETLLARYEQALLDAAAG
jgi:colanic acid biosynthesis glycosyl transferase WcaI